MQSDQLSEAEIALEQFKLKKLIRMLQNERSSGTSVVSVYIPPKKVMCEVTNKLGEEIAEAGSIKDKGNRQSVQEAISSAKEKLKKYNKAPKNGLVVFSGILQQADGKGEKKICIDIEPYRPIQLSMYFCDSTFHVEELRSLLHTDPPFGFIVMDGSGSLFATIQGNSKEILKSFEVDLPKKHNKGGQSSVRFARLRTERRLVYLKKVCETATQVFISDNMPTVKGLILAGAADFKSDLGNSQFFDGRLKSLILKVVDVGYGGENGLNQAIQLSQECLQQVKYVRERELVGQFFEQIDRDTGLVVYGVQDTMKAIEANTIKTVVCSDALEYYRIELQSRQTNEKSIRFIKGEEGATGTVYQDSQTGEDLLVVLREHLVEYLTDNYITLGLDLQLISDKSAEGNQFLKGFSGLGGFLRFKMDMEYIVNQQEWKNEDDDDFI